MVQRIGRRTKRGNSRRKLADKMCRCQYCQDEVKCKNMDAHEHEKCQSARSPNMLREAQLVPSS